MINSTIRRRHGCGRKFDGDKNRGRVMGGYVSKEKHSQQSHFNFLGSDETCEITKCHRFAEPRNRLIRAKANIHTTCLRTILIKKNRRLQPSTLLWGYRTGRAIGAHAMGAVGGGPRCRRRTGMTHSSFLRVRGPRGALGSGLQYTPGSRRLVRSMRSPPPPPSPPPHGGPWGSEGKSRFGEGGRSQIPGTRSAALNLLRQHPVAETPGSVRIMTRGRSLVKPELSA